MNSTERDALIAYKYLEENATAAQLSREFGLTTPRIYQILQDQGASKGGAKGARRTSNSLGEGGRAISQVHVNIGLCLYRQRKLVDNVDRDYTSERLNWSVKRLALVEKGETELSLTDLIQIARHLGTTPGQLIDDCMDTGFGVELPEETQSENAQPPSFSLISGSLQKTR